MTLYINGHSYSLDIFFNFNPKRKQPFIKAEVTSLLNKKSIPIIGLMDTGSTTSVLTFETAKRLDITKPQKGKMHKYKTATGQSVKGYQHPVTMQVISSSGNLLIFTLNPIFTNKIKKDIFGMDWTLNFCLAFDRQKVHLLRD